MGFKDRPSLTPVFFVPRLSPLLCVEGDLNKIWSSSSDIVVLERPGEEGGILYLGPSLWPDNGAGGMGREGGGSLCQESETQEQECLQEASSAHDQGIRVSKKVRVNFLCFVYICLKRKQFPITNRKPVSVAVSSKLTRNIHT